MFHNYIMFHNSIVICIGCRDGIIRVSRLSLFGVNTPKYCNFLLYVSIESAYAYKVSPIVCFLGNPWVIKIENVIIF